MFFESLQGGAFLLVGLCTSKLGNLVKVLAIKRKRRPQLPPVPPSYVLIILIGILLGIIIDYKEIIDPQGSFVWRAIATIALTAFSFVLCMLILFYGGSQESLLLDSESLLVYGEIIVANLGISLGTLHRFGQISSVVICIMVFSQILGFWLAKKTFLYLHK